VPPALELFATPAQGQWDAGDLHHHGLCANAEQPDEVDPEIGARIVPIVPDEARTFGMEGMFPQFGIYSAMSASCTVRKMPIR
jgi:hypothetical protein